VAQEFEHYYQGNNQGAITPAPLARALTREFPEIISATRLQCTENVLLSHGEKNFLESNFFFADPETFEIFTLEMLKGDPNTALDNPYSMVISETMASKYFGSQDPMGKRINYKNSSDFTVTGVLKNMPGNSHFVMDFVVPFETLGELTGRDLTRWGISGFYTYILLHEGVDVAELEAKLPTFLEKYWDENYPVHDRYFLQALTRIHLHSHLLGELTPNNDINNIYLYISIAFLILVIACINYMNLTTARSIQRGKEVGIRRIVGAQRGQLIRQFLCESAVLAFISLLVSFAIAELVLPACNSFVERDLSFNIAGNLPLLLWFFVLTALVGIGAGSYPAFVISTYRPVSVLRSDFKRGSKGGILRNALVVFQFTISIALIVCTLVVKRQLDFIRSKDVGYRKDQIVAVTVRDRAARRNIGTIRSELKRNSNIISVSSSSNLPNHITSQGRASWPGMQEDIDIPIYVGLVDYDFTDLYEIEIVEGRSFSREFTSDANGAFLLNESAVEVLGWESPVGKDFTHRGHLGAGGTGKIVGVMKDFHSHSLHQKIEPLYLYLDPGQDHSFLSVTIKGDNIPKTIEFMKDRVEAFSPNYPFEYHFFDELFNDVYRSEQKLGSLLSIFSLLAVFIACLGLLGLVSITTEQRTKEIGIRKVMGATVSNIVLLLSMDFLKWVVVANAIAWPVSYYAMNKWLQDFAYRPEFKIWIFLLSAVLALLIALISIGCQAIKAGFSNPVDTLRYE
jgi:putative ABC transport system permease protein